MGQLVLNHYHLRTLHKPTDPTRSVLITSLATTRSKHSQPHTSPFDSLLTHHLHNLGYESTKARRQLRSSLIMTLGLPFRIVIYRGNRTIIGKGPAKQSLPVFSLLTRAPDDRPVLVHERPRGPRRKPLALQVWVPTTHRHHGAESCVARLFAPRRRWQRLLRICGEVLRRASATSSRLGARGRNIPSC